MTLSRKREDELVEGGNEQDHRDDSCKPHPTPRLNDGFFGLIHSICASAGAVRVPDLVPEHQRVPSIALPLKPALDALLTNDVLRVGAIGCDCPRALEGVSISFRDCDSVLAVINKGEPVAAFAQIGAVRRKSWCGNQSQYGRHKNCSHPANIIRNSERVNAH